MHQRYGTRGDKPNPEVLHTTDNWLTTDGKICDLASAMDAPTDVAALDGQTAWLMGGINGAPSLPVLLKTTTGAQGFARMPATLPAALRKIHFFSATTGIAVGDAPAGARTWPIYRTSDGGLNWVPVASTPASTTAGAEEIRQKISHPATANGLWLITSANTALHTADAGLTWSATPNIRWVAFEDALQGLAIRGSGSSQELLRTANGGSTWTSMVTSSLPTINTMAAVPGAPGTYVSGGHVIEGVFTVVSQTAISRNRGVSWQVIATEHTVFEDLIASGPAQLWAVATYAGGPTNASQRLFMRLRPTVLGTRQPLDPALRATAYPNPTTGLLRLDGPLRGEENVRVHDAAGRLCQVGKVSENRRAVDLTALRPGLYQLVLTAADGAVRSLNVSKTE
ncbi:hypothetical protein BEN47_05625 [Hymenobacter lapidarius]|uniref:Secretion system C-terminal sorting domain-containing protein n=1 Tax=Hymenobacter lapidarius TaxID=1908237 RepID=A0A1G1SS46_9BACT|nr:T9SS type A sorting domain-containing protein [Hymenobacter lapidarius]OGX81427.1 hypothetical protein BEN47_05625 [Hymenobacter lapidarius]